MIRLTSLQQPPAELPCVGGVRSVDAPSGRVMLWRRFEVPELGSFSRGFCVPLYDAAELADARPEEEAMPVLGAAADCGFSPIAYFTAERGAYCYLQPIYKLEDFSSLGWRRRGYIFTDQGKIEVRTRRAGFWALLAVAAAFAFAAGYLGMRYGWPGALDAVKSFFAGLS